MLFQFDPRASSAQDWCLGEWANMLSIPQFTEIRQVLVHFSASIAEILDKSSMKMLFRPSYDSNHPTYILAKCSQRNLIFSSPRNSETELKAIRKPFANKCQQFFWDEKELSIKEDTTNIGHIEEMMCFLKRKPEITSDRCLQTKDPFLWNKKLFFSLLFCDTKEIFTNKIAF